MYMAANHIIWFQTIYMVIYLVWESTRNSKSARVRPSSQPVVGCFSADIQANSQFFESNDNSEVKQIREDIYNTYNQKLSLPTIWENMPNNCQIQGITGIFIQNSKWSVVHTGLSRGLIFGLRLAYGHMHQLMQAYRYSM